MCQMWPLSYVCNLCAQPKDHLNSLRRLGCIKEEREMAQPLGFRCKFNNLGRVKADPLGKYWASCQPWLTQT